MTKAGDVLVLGIGNILLRDDGVGVHVARALAAAPDDVVDGHGLPSGTRVVDGGTLGLDLLPLLDGARALIVVDAMALGLPPGSVRVLRDGSVRSAVGAVRTVHDLGLSDLIEVARLAGRLPPALTVIGVQAESTAIGTELTASVAAAVPRAVELARCEAWAFEAAASSAPSLSARTHGRPARCALVARGAPEDLTVAGVRCRACRRVYWWRQRQMVFSCHDRPPRKVGGIVVRGPDDWTCACGLRVDPSSRVGKALDRMPVSA